MDKIMVTGATGGLGKAIIGGLLKRLPAEQVIGSARNPAQATDAGVEIRQADYTDYDALVASMRGIDKLFLVSAVAFTDRTAQHRNVIRAAKAAGVRHIFYPSIQRKHGVAVQIDGVTASDIETEQLLRDSGLAYTILQHPLYVEALQPFLGDQIASLGVRAPAGGGRIPLTGRDDLALAAAAILTQNGHENTEIALNAGISYSFDDVAAAYATALGVPVSYTAISRDDYIAERVAAGLPLPVAEFFSGWLAAIAAGAFDNPDPTLEKLIGRPARPLVTLLATR
jgi:NAD(P)H dehydrogenase (quinone)